MDGQRKVPRKGLLAYSIGAFTAGVAFYLGDEIAYEISDFNLAFACRAIEGVAAGSLINNGRKVGRGLEFRAKEFYRRQT